VQEEGTVGKNQRGQLGNSGVRRPKDQRNTKSVEQDPRSLEQSWLRPPACIQVEGARLPEVEATDPEGEGTWMRGEIKRSDKGIGPHWKWSHRYEYAVEGQG